MRKKSAKAPKVARLGARKPRTPTEAERRFLEQLGASIKAARLARSTTAQRLAEAVGITLAPQYNREAGRVSMPVEDIYRYAIALRISPRDLLPE